MNHKDVWRSNVAKYENNQGIIILRLTDITNVVMANKQYLGFRIYFLDFQKPGKSNQTFYIDPLLQLNTPTKLLCITIMVT